MQFAFLKMLCLSACQVANELLVHLSFSTESAFLVVSYQVVHVWMQSHDFYLFLLFHFIRSCDMLHESLCPAVHANLLLASPPIIEIHNLCPLSAAQIRTPYNTASVPFFSSLLWCSILSLSVISRFFFLLYVSVSSFHLMGFSILLEFTLPFPFYFILNSSPPSLPSGFSFGDLPCALHLTPVVSCDSVVDLASVFDETGHELGLLSFEVSSSSTWSIF